MAGGQGQIAAVVGRSWIGPRHDRTAITGVVVTDNVTGNTGENRILIVSDGDIESLGVSVAGGIGGGQSHGRSSNREEIAAVVAALKIGNFAVVEGIGSVPHDDGTAGTGIIGLGDIRRHVNDLRIFLIFNGHDEALAAGVAVDVCHGVGHRSFTDRQHRSALDTGNQAVDGTVVRHVRSCPGSGSQTDSRLCSDSNAVRQVGNHGILEVLNRNQDRILGHIAVDVGQGEGHFSGTHIEVLTRLSIGDDALNTTVVGCRCVVPRRHG